MSQAAGSSLLIPKINYGCQQYFDGSFKMVQYIIKKNERVFAVMAQLGVSDDPNDDKPVLHGMPNRPKRELIDQLPPIISISVVTGSGLEASVSVLPCWFDRGVLQSELTKDSINLLLEAPPAVPASFAPPPY